jgi:hypothetical protein
MATATLDAIEEQQRTVHIAEAEPAAQAPATAPAPTIDSAAVVAEAARITSVQQAPAPAAKPTELSPEVAAWIAEVAQRGCASASEVILWLVAMVVFLAITTAGIWMNATSSFPHLQP